MYNWLLETLAFRLFDNSVPFLMYPITSNRSLHCIFEHSESVAYLVIRFNSYICGYMFHTSHHHTTVALISRFTLQSAGAEQYISASSSHLITPHFLLYCNNFLSVIISYYHLTMVILYYSTTKFFFVMYDMSSDLMQLFSSLVHCIQLERRSTSKDLFLLFFMFYFSQLFKDQFTKDFKVKVIYM